MYSDDTIYYRPERSTYRSGRQTQPFISVPEPARPSHREPPRWRFEGHPEPERPRKAPWAERVAQLESTVEELRDEVARLEKLLKEQNDRRPEEPARREERPVRFEHKPERRVEVERERLPERPRVEPPRERLEPERDRTPVRRAPEQIPPLEEFGAVGERRGPEKKRAPRAAGERPAPVEPKGDAAPQGLSGFKSSAYPEAGTQCMLGEPRYTG